jgi:hypothetical protein
MPTKYWQGTTGNWNTGANWSGGTIPAANDVAVFDDSSQGITTEPSVGIVLTALYVTPNYTGSWGSSGNTIGAISATDCVIRHNAEEFWFEPSIMARATLGPMSSGANALVFGGAATSLGHTYVTGGQVTIAASTTMGAVTATGLDGASPSTWPPNLIISSGVTWSSTYKVICNAGRIELHDAPESTTDEFVACHGGEIWHRAGPIDNVFVTGGTYRHDAGAISQVIMTGGFWDAAQSTTERTIGNFYIFGPNSIADFRNSANQGQPTNLIPFGSPTYYLTEGSYSV